MEGETRSLLLDKSKKIQLGVNFQFSTDTGWSMYGPSKQCKRCYSDVRSVLFGIIGIPTFGNSRCRVYS
jgi:7-cyano-7-deazaguanine synthase in queuosine biosynthesis